MVLNKQIDEILKEYKLDVNSSKLCLLAIYYGLDVNKIIPEDVIKGIQLTKIVVKSFPSNAITWNVPLFEGQQTEWGWVEKWNNMFGTINPERKDNYKDVLKRMIEFFKQYPAYRVSDVRAGTQMYFTTVSSPTYLKSSAKFIFEGKGVDKISHLAKWCEMVASKENKPNDGMIGRMAGQ